ncbi:hypothetical protein EDB86DRAFT_2904414 [Lactarius hatsudake]|nr:hypothetical protein EDB86DRAFT_2904414 [Lactarius hatsudake]
MASLTLCFEWSWVRPHTLLPCFPWALTTASLNSAELPQAMTITVRLITSKGTASSSIVNLRSTAVERITGPTAASHRVKGVPG